MLKSLDNFFKADYENFLGEINQDFYLINGKILKWNGNFETVFSPVCEEKNGVVSKKVLGKYPLLTKNEALQALESSVLAYNNGKGFWPTLSVEKRIEHIQSFVTKMKEKREEVVNLLMWEIGKSKKDSQKEFDRTVDYILGTIDALKDLDRVSSTFTIKEGIVGQVRRAPLGVVLCMGPFNYPLNETFTTLIPALIMGNTVIFKPPKLGVLLHSPLLEVFKESFPKGVVNTVYGEGEEVIKPLLESGKIDVLAFIGSSRVADILKKQHPKPHRMKSVLGLEAKNAGIILKNADLQNTVDECISGTLSFNGQRCTALKILFVHEDIVEDFLSLFKEKLSNLKVGLPWEEDVNITPLPEPNKTNYLTALIKDATKKGAKVINENGGKFNETIFIPAVLYPVNKTMKIYNEEQFGPVIPVVPYKNIETPLDYVENSNYGQQVAIFGTNSDELASLIDPLVNQVCRVNINSQCQRGPDVFPFTGRKDSAEGTLSVSDALRVFSIRTLVSFKENELNKKIVSSIVKGQKSNFLSTNFLF